MILNYSAEHLKQNGAYLTAVEISQQPKLWKRTFSIIEKRKNEIKEFLDEIVDENEHFKIIFTGAGSSSFIGKIVSLYFSNKFSHNIEAVPTTEIITNPECYFFKKTPTLLISFARSGNSPESTAAIKLASHMIDDLYQIAITCNSNGKLAQEIIEFDKSILLLMPDKAHDKGFAMTSSFTTMLLSAILIFELDNLSKLKNIINNVIDVGNEIIENFPKELSKVSVKESSRMVFLASSLLSGVAEEAALKILELTQGKIVTVHNTYLGFRHGPKSIINKDTIICGFLSNNDYIYKYEKDLFKELKEENIGKKIIGITAKPNREVKNLADHLIFLNNETLSKANDIFLTFNYLLFVQIFAFNKSLKFGLSPDNPSPSGEVNRVVKGVKIYKLTNL